MARPVRLRPWLIWGTILVAVTLVLHGAREHLDQAHVVLPYLIIVLGASAAGGRAVALTLACIELLLIDYFFQVPYDRLLVGKPLDWLILISFLTTAFVTTGLLTRARAEAEAARQRAEEVASFARLGAETLGAGQAEDALVAVATVIRDTLRVPDCEIYHFDGGGRLALAARVASSESEALASVRGLVNEAVRQLHAMVMVADGTCLRATPAPTDVDGIGLEIADARAVAVPLVAHERTVGVLLAADRSPLHLDAARRRCLTALAYYAALAVERVRLVAEAEHAEALRAADRLKDALIASVSHDLRTPLTTIRALAQVAAARGDPHAAIIQEQAERLNRIVGDLLDLWRIRAGALPVRLEPNTAEDLIGALGRQVSGLLGRRQLVTSLDTAQPVLAGSFDFVQSLRILTNLVENALRYAPGDDPIDIEVRREAEWLVFTVADRGPGVAPSERERIFRPFYRASAAPHDTGHAGLGLFISRQLAELQGGSLDYAPRSGGGSALVLRLPALDLVGT